MANIIGKFTVHNKYGSWIDSVRFTVYDNFKYTVNDSSLFIDFKIIEEQVFIRHDGELVFRHISPTESGGKYKEFVENILMTVGEYNMLNSPSVIVKTTIGDV